MKSVMKNLAILTMGLLIYSCNEKISPELQSGNSTTIPTATVPDEFYFRVVNNSAAVLNYKLHRTGSGNANVDCKVATTALPLSSTLYVGDGATPHDSKSYDISCFMEAEELSMFFNGLSYKIEASKNTCEYVGYSPYSYFDAIPGSSTTHYAGVTCVLPVSSGAYQADLNSAAAVTAIDAQDVNGLIPCNTMVDTNVPVALRVYRPIPEDYQRICGYDYETNGGGNGQNCDTGRISFTVINIIDARLAPTDPMNPEPAPVEVPDHSCGGDIVSCVAGPIKQIDPTLMRVTDIGATQLNKDYSQTYNLPALIGKRSDMYDIVNYRRGLASLDLNYMDYTTANDVNWGDPSYFKSFDPALMEKYAANRNPDNTAIVYFSDPSPLPQPTATVSFATYEAHTQVKGWTNTPYAADPFLGIEGARVNPFYTFYCLDRAMEIKARIRMVVRDWDRVFSSSASDMELITDVYKNIGARRQDLPTDEDEIPNDPGSYNLYNDKDDWDVLIPMRRTDPNLTGVYDPADTFWTPQPTASFLTGFWDPLYFPNQGPVD